MHRKKRSDPDVKAQMPKSSTRNTRSTLDPATEKVYDKIAKELDKRPKRGECAPKMGTLGPLCGAGEAG